MAGIKETKSKNGRNKIVNIDSDLEYIKQFKFPMNIKEIWSEMDKAWDTIILNTSNPTDEELKQFYRHPVWALNGIFVKQDSESLLHRLSISAYCKKLSVSRIIDYGGGSGFLVETINKSYEKKIAFSYDPFNESELISLTNEDIVAADVIIIQDVLEHVRYPVEQFQNIINCSKIGTIFIVANCFYPVIKCHLPTNFYLRYTFSLLFMIAGLQYVGKVQGASHVNIYRKKKELNNKRIQSLNYLAKLLGPLLNLILDPIKSNIKKLF